MGDRLVFNERPEAQLGWTSRGSKPKNDEDDEDQDPFLKLCIEGFFHIFLFAIEKFTKQVIKLIIFITCR